MAMGETGQGRLIPAGQLARALAVPSSVLSYYEAKVPGLRAVADQRGGRAYRRGDAMVLAGIAAEVDEGTALSDVLTRLGSTGRDSVGLRGRRLIDQSFPIGTETTAAPARPVPGDAIVVSRGTRLEAPVDHRLPPQRHALLRELAECIQILQNVR